MHPVLFTVGAFQVRLYGTFIAMGFLAGTYMAIIRARTRGIPKEFILDLSFYMLLSGLIGAKLLHIVLFPSFYLSALRSKAFDAHSLISLLGSGLVFYGGLALAVPTGIFFIKTKGYSLPEIADVLAPALPLAHAFGRLGCFSAGCCYGKACSLPWAVTFSSPLSLAPLHVPLHPTQLYSSLANFLLALLILLLSKAVKTKGLLFLTYLGLYSEIRFLIEILRDDDRGFLFHHLLSTSQFISIIVFSTALLLMITLITKQAKLPAHSARIGNEELGIGNWE